MRFPIPLLPMLAAVSLPLPAQSRPSAPWTLPQAMAELRTNRHDPLLQYVAMQLARRAGAAGAADQVRQWVAEGGRTEVERFGLFTGALAVQESLQLDTMLGPVRSGRAALPRPDVAIASLSGPTVRSHPWRELLQGHTPAVSRLSGMVPADFYLLEFRSPGQLQAALAAGDPWAGFLLQQTAHAAAHGDVAARMAAQLGLGQDALPRLTQSAGAVAVTGSDLYFGEGTDVTVLFALTGPDAFRGTVQASLDEARRAHADAVEGQGTFHGVAYRHVATPDRALHVFTADPAPDLHVRSNSRAALERVLAAVRGDPSAPRLAETEEFRYLRVLLPDRASEEDGFLYLSDPFVRRQVGPQVKIAALRRLVCLGHLRMIGHAALLHRCERGAAATTLAALHRADCAPGVFGEGPLACPDGGTYRLAADGRGVCSRHGEADALTPLLDLPLGHATYAEEHAYGEFRRDYERYWARYFDPIAVRLRITPERQRVETLVLPLIGNTIYTRLLRAVGKETAVLDALPVAQGSLFTVAVHLDPGQLAAGAQEWLEDWLDKEAVPTNLDAVFRQGLGPVVSVHLCDAAPMVDVSIPDLLDLFGFDVTGGIGLNPSWSCLIAALCVPVYVAIPVRDARLVDQFLAELDQAMAARAASGSESNLLPTAWDFGLVPDTADVRVRSGAFQFGPFKWRLFWARIDDGLYLASRRELLDQVCAARLPVGAPARADLPTGHAMARFRPGNLRLALPDYRLSWAENQRAACQEDLGLLGTVAALERATGMDAVLAAARRLHGRGFRCPDGGSYTLLPGQRAACSVHGTRSEPRQPLAPTAASAAAEVMARIEDATATVTLTPEGLRAVLEIRRK